MKFLILFFMLSGVSLVADSLTIPQSPLTAEEQRIIPITISEANKLLGMDIELSEDDDLIWVWVKLGELFYKNLEDCDARLTVTILPDSKDEIIFGTTLNIFKKEKILDFGFGRDYRFRFILPIESGCQKLKPGKYVIEIDEK